MVIIRGSNPSSWTIIVSNYILHKNRFSQQTIKNTSSFSTDLFEPQVLTLHSRDGVSPLDAVVLYTGYRF